MAPKNNPDDGAVLREMVREGLEMFQRDPGNASMLDSILGGFFMHPDVTREMIQKEANEIGLGPKIGVLLALVPNDFPPTSTSVSYHISYEALKRSMEDSGTSGFPSVDVIDVARHLASIGVDPEMTHHAARILAEEKYGIKIPETDSPFDLGGIAYLAIGQKGVSPDYLPTVIGKLRDYNVPPETITLAALDLGATVEEINAARATRAEPRGTPQDMTPLKHDSFSINPLAHRLATAGLASAEDMKEAARAEPGGTPQDPLQDGTAKVDPLPIAGPLRTKLGETFQVAASPETRNPVPRLSKPEIKALQTFLRDSGHSPGNEGPQRDGLDGRWGPKTAGALKEALADPTVAADLFANRSLTRLVQTTVGASPDGTYGPKTLEAAARYAGVDPDKLPAFQTPTTTLLAERTPAP